MFLYTGMRSCFAMCAKHPTIYGVSESPDHLLDAEMSMNRL